MTEIQWRRKRRTGSDKRFSKFNTISDHVPNAHASDNAENVESRNCEGQQSGERTYFVGRKNTSDAGSQRKRAGAVTP